MDGGNRRPGHGPDPSALLRVAEHFLRRRHFIDCRKYALQAQQSDPNLPGAAQLLAVADVLQTSEKLVTGSQPDWYAVLQLDRFSCDAGSIRERYNHLSFLLNPSTNRFPFADQAFNVVRDALYVLSNPLKKSAFDSELNDYVGGNGSGGEKSNGFSFWTVCPYCYYVYEYPRVYVECCMRCPNEKCARAFHTVEIQKPPVEVLRGGEYICAGFLPLGFPWNQGKWNPFSPKTSSENVGGEGESVQVSEDSSDDDDDLDLFGVNNAERVETDAVSGIAHITPEIGEKATMRKRKSVAKNTKKLTGTGNRVKKFVPQSCEESELNEHSSDDGGQDISSGVAGVEFYDGEDDIFVRLQDHDDT